MKQQHELPLLHDHHSHISLYAALSSCPNISHRTAAEALEFLYQRPRDKFSVIRGWKSSLFSLSPSDLASLPPLLLINTSLHGFAVTDSGLPFLEAAAPDLARGRNDSQWLEANVPLIFAAYCDLVGLGEPGLQSFFLGLEEVGVGSVEDLAVSSLTAFETLQKSELRSRMAFWAAPELFGRLETDKRESCSGIKLFLDGALGARSAAIRGNWLGPGTGILVYDRPTLESWIEQASAWNTGLAIHAIGEIAIDQALDVLETILHNGGSLPCIRLEHVQFIDRLQAFRARDMGIILSMQPNFTVDSVDYADRLPAARLAANNPFRMLIDQGGFEPGKDLLFGSDGMPHGLAFAARWSLFPPYEGQRLKLEELIAGYGAARGITGTFMLEVDTEEESVKILDGSHQKLRQ